MTIKLEDVKLLRAGDVVYRTYRQKAGNTKMSVQIIDRITIKEVQVLAGDQIVFITGGTRPERRAHEMTSYSLFHPTPKRGPWDWGNDPAVFEKKVAAAAEKAAAERKMWRERRKAAKASD
jgi:hypothetical protein